MTDVPLETATDAGRRGQLVDTDVIATRRGPSWLAAGSPAPTVLGLVVVIVGFGLLGVGWGLVARETTVALQLPYLISAGLTGLGLIMAGLVLVNISTKRQDAAERARQMDQLTLVIRELKASIDDEGAS